MRAHARQASVALTLVFVTAAAGAAGAEEAAPEPATRAPSGFFLSDPMPVHFDFRGGIFVRNDHGYYHDARVFAEAPRVSTNTAVAEGSPIPPAGGVTAHAGVAILPRTTLGVSFSTYTNGVEEGETKLSLTTRRFGADLSFAVLRTPTPSALAWAPGAQLDLTGGVGYYYFQEDFLDRALFDTTQRRSANSLGGHVGVDVLGYVGPFGAVIGYAYHLAGASISDRIGGSVAAGGHEINIGLALRL